MCPLIVFNTDHADHAAHVDHLNHGGAGHIVVGHGDALSEHQKALQAHEALVQVLIEQ